MNTLLLNSCERVAANHRRMHEIGLIFQALGDSKYEHPLYHSWIVESDELTNQLHEAALYGFGDHCVGCKNAACLKCGANPEKVM